MSKPLTPEEIAYVTHVLAVRRPLHWRLATRLLREVMASRAADGESVTPAPSSGATARQERPSSPPVKSV